MWCGSGSSFQYEVERINYTNGLRPTSPAILLATPANATLQELKQALRTTATMTVFRKLKALD
jgi:hypothetical protein